MGTNPHHQQQTHSTTTNTYPNKLHQHFTMATLSYLPPVKPSAVALGTVYSHPSPLLCSAPSSVTPTVRPRPPTPRRSSSSPRRLPPPPLPGVLPSSAPPSSPTVSVPSSTPLVLSPTRAPPTSAP